MRCTNCKWEIKDYARFCTRCGAPVDTVESMVTGAAAGPAGASRAGSEEARFRDVSRLGIIFKNEGAIESGLTESRVGADYGQVD